MTITTRTTLVPVTVTEVKNGTVMQTMGTSIIVRTGDEIKMFSQSDIDKRGVKIMRGGQPASISDFRTNDKLTATIVTTMPPKILTEQEVQATLAKAAPARAASPAPAAPTAAAASPEPARTLPKTASSWPLLGVSSALSLAIGFALTLRRRFV